MLASLVTFFLIGLVTLIVAGIALAIAGTVFSIAWTLAGFLLFKVAPIALVGYIVVRFLAPRSRRLTSEERKWLEG